MFTLNDYFSQVFLVHMDSDTQRVPHMEQQFKKINTKYTLRPGVLPSEEERRTFTTPLCQQFCSKSMLGIYLAHRRLWEEIVAKELPSAVIFEDDVVFTEDIAKRFPQAMKELPEDWDLLHLGCLSCHESSLSTIHLFTNWSKLIKPSIKPYSNSLVIPETTFGTEAYALSLSGARKLLEWLPQAFNHVDFMISTQLSKLNHYLVYPQVAYQHPEGFKYTNNGSSTPLLWNQTLSHIRLQSNNPYNHTNVAYALSIPIGQLHDTIIINGWSMIFFLCGIAHTWSAFIALLMILIDFVYALYVSPNKIKVNQYAFYIYMTCMGILIRNLL